MSMLTIKKIKMNEDEAKDNLDLIERIVNRTNKMPRTDQILALEITMTLENYRTVSNIEIWKERCRKWLRDKFDVAADQSNIFTWIFNFDAEGNAHITSLIIPVDEDGDLNASRFLHGTHVQNELQISYNEYTKNIGVPWRNA